MQYAAVVTRNGKEERIPVYPDICHTGIIVLNYPGLGGTAEGYNEKYITIGALILQQIGTYVRIDNRIWDEKSYAETVVDDLAAVIEQVLLAKSAELSGHAIPQIHLMGTSAGASAIAAVCSRYLEITKLLLTAPSVDATWAAMEASLREFTGEVSVLCGANDYVVGTTVGEHIIQASQQAKVTRYEVLPDCDHQFRGRTNGLILSKAPLWAFAGETSFPSTEGGVELY